MQITIEVPETITFASGERGGEQTNFTFALADVDAERLEEWAARAFIAGLVKTGVDAAAGAKEYAEKNASVPGMSDRMAREHLIGKRLAAWRKGQWLSRGTGDGVDEVTKAAIGLTAEAVKASDPRKYKSAGPAERAAMRAEYFENLPAAQKATLMKQATATLEVRQKAARDLAAIRAGVEL
jgi:hypothetical protein